MINIPSTFRRNDHPIRLNKEFHRDLTWWQELLRSWEGLSFFLTPTWAPLPDFQVSSDAAGSLGYGAIFNNQWFFGAWSASQQPLSIAYKELFPIVVGGTCGDLGGRHSGSSLYVTTRLWWLCCLLVPPEILT